MEVVYVIIAILFFLLVAQHFYFNRQLYWIEKRFELHKERMDTLEKYPRPYEIPKV